AALRLLLLGSKSIWVDEAYAIGLAQMDLPDLLRLSASATPHPPLFFLVLKLSGSLFGSTATGLRLLPALISASSVLPLFMFLRRRFSLWSAFWVSCLWAVCPYAVSLAQEAWVYGLLAAATIWAIDLADRAWRGSRRALAAFLLVSWAGFLVQPLFALSYLAALALWLTLPPRSRCPARNPLIALAAGAAGLAVALIPCMDFIGASAERKAAAGFYAGRLAALPGELATTMARLLPDGLFPEITRNLLERPRMMTAVVLVMLLETGALVFALTSRALRRPLRLWVLGVLLGSAAAAVPLVAGARPFSLLWAPLAVALALVFSRWRPAGPACVLLTGLALVPYYCAGSHPYHRSDWSAAVRLVESRIDTSSERVLVLSGQSGGIAWDFYSSSPGRRVALGADENPYRPRSVRDAEQRSPSAALDSLLLDGTDVWLVIDLWGGRPPLDLPPPSGRIGLDTLVSECMRVVRLDSQCQQERSH
ncbi:glycosyltransferase family 39 protein, partial [Candidatus Fermentibacterales bacterium]|nr:glycosyltransferase family 39 protein [Candidatus Fermentibacterales bacterium]